MKKGQGSLVRFNETLRGSTIRAVVAEAVKGERVEYDKAATALVTKLIPIWIDTDPAMQREFTYCPERWFQYFDFIPFRVPFDVRDPELAYLSNPTILRLTVNRHLPLMPSWMEKHKSSSWLGAYIVPDSLLSEFRELARSNSRIQRMGDEITTKLGAGLSGMRYVRDVRATFPELDKFLPADRWGEQASDPTMSLAIDYGPLHELLRKHNIGNQEAVVTS